jgi:DsbC/DsbD-like thiol-disulfide interchange protein
LSRRFDPGQNPRRIISRDFWHGLLAAIVAMGMFAGVGAASSIAAQPSGAELVKASLLIDRASIKAGEPFYAAVRLTVAPGWHVYWKNPGDAGVSTTVDWTLPAGWHAEELLYPIPRRFDSTGDITTFGYEDEVVLMARIVPGAEPASGAKLGAKVSYLVCKEQCIPGEADAELPLPTGNDGGSGDAVQPQVIEQWLALVPKTTAPSEVASVDQKAVPMATRLDAFGAADVVLVVKWVIPKPEDRPADIDFFSVPGDSLKLSNVRITDYGDETRITFRAEVLAGSKLTSPSFEGVVAYMATGAAGKPRRAVTVPIRLVDTGR